MQKIKEINVYQRNERGHSSSTFNDKTIRAKDTWN